jgi:hypothetical protein
MLAMTDDVGILQHATLDVPNRSCGYCTDDVGRALIVACDAAARQPAAQRLVTTYLAYLHDAQMDDGWFHNFMGYDRRWQDQRGTPDAVGRAIWGLGFAERHAPRETWRSLAGRMRRRAMAVIPTLQHVRSCAYAALGLVHALASRPDDELALRPVLDGALATIAAGYDAHAAPDWQWCEDVLTYDNARLCEALLRGGAALGEERYVRIGLAMLEFYTSVAIDPADGIFVPIGNAGWYPRGGVRSRSAQQPLEAASMVDAAFAALEVTGDPAWREIAETAHAWYHGGNTRRAVLARDGGGCCDGLDDAGANCNMGAESTISYLMSATAMAARSKAPLRAVR